MKRTTCAIAASVVAFGSSLTARAECREELAAVDAAMAANVQLEGEPLNYLPRSLSSCPGFATNSADIDGDGVANGADNCPLPKRGPAGRRLRWARRSMRRR